MCYAEFLTKKLSHILTHSMLILPWHHLSCKHINYDWWDDDLMVHLDRLIRSQELNLMQLLSEWSSNLSLMKLMQYGTAHTTKYLKHLLSLLSKQVILQSSEMMLHLFSLERTKNNSLPSKLSSMTLSSYSIAKRL